MANFNSFPGPLGGLMWAIIAGGDDTDPAQDHNGGQRLFSPTDHSPKGVQKDHLPFSPRSISPTQQGQQSFGGVLDPGTPVLIMKSQGNPGGVIVGAVNSMFNSGSGGGGGTSLFEGNPVFQDLKNRKLNVKGPPHIQESTDADGVKIRKIQESGEQHHLGLLEGLPLHGALFNMSGFRLPELPNIPTAKQTNDGMMTMEMMQQMMGQIMSLGQMFAGLAGRRGAGGGGGGIPNGFASNRPDDAYFVYTPNTSNTTANTSNTTTEPYFRSEYYLANNRLEVIQGAVPTEMALAIGNLARIVQGLEVDEGVSFFTGSVVHEQTYLQNAENLLVKVKTMDDLMNVLSRLQHDESLFGRDKLKNVTVSVNTAYGTANSTVNIDGEVLIEYDSNTWNNINTFANTITSNTDSPAIGSVDFLYTSNTSNGGSGGGGSGGGGGGGGGSGGGSGAAGLMGMFGKSAQTMQDMMKRLHPEGQKTAEELHKKLNKDQKAQKLFDIAKKTINDGNPLDPGLFQDGGVG